MTRNLEIDIRFDGGRVRVKRAGIPRTRRKLYLGHSAGDVTDLYERHEITAFLADDRARLVGLLGAANAALEAM